MLNLTLPESTDYPASVFTQDGEFVIAGNREECELTAMNIKGLYCLNIQGKPVIKHDFENI